MSNFDVLELISDKLNTYRELEKHNLRVPEYAVIHSVDEVKEALRRYQYIILIDWWRDRDSNPGRGLTLAGFQDRCIQPLCHPSEASYDTVT